MKKDDKELSVGLFETVTVLLCIGYIASKSKYYKGLIDGRREKKEELLLEIKEELRKENSKD
jgi:LytS/YehU family sensor histidine kinase